jgi:hypothetical protein
MCLASVAHHRQYAAVKAGSLEGHASPRRKAAQGSESLAVESCIGAQTGSHKFKEEPVNKEQKPQSAVEAVFKRIEALGLIIATKRAAGNRRDQKAREILERMDAMERQVADELAILVWEGAQVHADKITRMVTPSGTQGAAEKER